MGTEKGHRPTPKQMRKGPTVTLDGGVRWADRSFSPHGLAYNVQFDGKGKAKMLKRHFDEWIDESVAAYDGITVVKPQKKKPTIKEAVNVG